MDSRAIYSGGLSLALVACAIAAAGEAGLTDHEDIATTRATGLIAALLPAVPPHLTKTRYARIWLGR